jgi:hypothetical protein
MVNLAFFGSFVRMASRPRSSAAQKFSLPWETL